jgi:crotonobetainyl-CoA:carnitine CoA-transferase CaiB-like acyl-CoA transferase
MPVLKPLAGVRIIDFTRHMSGPYATMVMGDFGADVVKVESLPNGDPSRATGTFYVEGVSTMFLTWNRNKRSIGIDLRNPEGVTIAQRLIAGADVVVENYTPSVADRIGIGYEKARELNPRIVYLSCSAFGSVGPWANRPGTDPVVQAISGVMSVTGERDGGPVLVGIPVADFASAMINVQAMLLGLMARDRSGEGQRIEAPMLAALALGLTTRVGAYFATGENPVRWGSQHSQVVPYQAFRTADGYAVAGAWDEKAWKPICSLLGIPDIGNDERFDTNPKRVENRDEITEILAARMVLKTTREWEKLFEEAGLLFAPVNTFSDVLESDHAKAMGLVEEFDHPVAGRIRTVAPAIRMTRTPADTLAAPPLLGQHTRAILAETGYSGAEIDRLLAEGLVVETQVGGGSRAR